MADIFRRKKYGMLSHKFVQKPADKEKEIWEPSKYNVSHGWNV
jgi:hypothetical protein